MSTPPGFIVHIRHEGPDVVVAVSGEVDLATAPVLWSRIQRGMAGGAKNLVIDLAGTTFMDSTGLAVIIRASAVYGASAVAVRSPQPRVLSLFSLTGLLRHIRVITHEQPDATATQGGATDHGVPGAGVPGSVV